MAESQEEKVVRLYAQGKWEEMVEDCDRNRFLPWVWPDRRSLEFIGESVGRQKCRSVISVGCGSGLLEWLLASATGLEVRGVETDGNWWRSRYSPGVFISMTFVEDSKGGDLGVEAADSALLFCYFNDSQAFLNYVDNFKGRCFVVIGPAPGRGTYAAPEPFRLPADLAHRWKLFDQQEIRSSRDFIAVYVRRSRPTSLRSTDDR